MQQVPLFSEDAEDALLERMDDLWWAMSRAERSALDEDAPALFLLSGQGRSSTAARLVLSSALGALTEQGPGFIRFGGGRTSVDGAAVFRVSAMCSVRVRVTAWVFALVRAKAGAMSQAVVVLGDGGRTLSVVIAGAYHEIPVTEGAPTKVVAQEVVDWISDPEGPAAAAGLQARIDGDGVVLTQSHGFTFEPPEWGDMRDLEKLIPKVPSGPSNRAQRRGGKGKTKRRGRRSKRYRSP